MSTDELSNGEILSQYLERLKTEVRHGPPPIVTIDLLSILAEHELIAKSLLEEMTGISARNMTGDIKNINQGHLSKIGLKLVGEVYYKLVKIEGNEGSD